MQSPVLALRADAGPEIGHGHFLRGLTLARAWQSRGYEVVFITACRTPALLDRLRMAGVAVLNVTDAHAAAQDLEVTLGWVSEHPNAWLVLDGYHFDASYQRAVKDGGARLLVLDDHGHADHYCADVLLEQGVRFVIRCAEGKLGGEIFIPKIPSARQAGAVRVCLPE